MHEEIKRAILDSIRAHERIILTRHLRPDGDAVGATMGLCRVLRRAFPDKRIWLANDDHAAALAFLGPEGEPPDAAQYDGALVIALDTGNAERLSNRHFRRAQKLIVIDHPHRDAPLRRPCVGRAGSLLHVRDGRGPVRIVPGRAAP